MSSHAERKTRLRGDHPPKVRLGWLASVAFCGVLPAVLVVLVFVSTVGEESAAIDFRQFYRAAEDILAGDDPYPNADDLLTASASPYPYPPFPALLAAPLTVLPRDVVAVLVMTVQVALVLGILWVLSVRDWRCYGIALLWPPVISAIQTGNPTLWLALAAAVTWRCRGRVAPSGASLGATLAVKFLLWPLLLWLAATRRVMSAVFAAAVAALLALASWAAIGFDGLRDYPDLLRRLEETVGDDAYTLSNLARLLGGSEGLSQAIWLVAGASLLVWCVLLARQGDERSSFVVALASALVLSPLVWLHYFSLLLVVVALGRGRLTPIWFVPLGMFVATGREDPTLFETSVTLTAAAVTFGLALRETRRCRERQRDLDLRALGGVGT